MKRMQGREANLLDYWKETIARYVVRKRAGRNQDTWEPAVTRGMISSIENRAANVTFANLIDVVRVIGGDISEAFASRVPVKFHDPKHQALHEKLQELLEASGDWPIAIRINVDAVYNEYIKEKEKSPKKK